MTLTLQITALSSVPNSSAIWRIGMYDTNNTFTSNQNAAPWSTTNEGYILGISTAPSDGGGTLLTNIYHKANSSGIVSTSGANSVTVVDRRMPPSGVTPVTMSMSVERLSSSEVRVSGYWLENGAAAGTLPAVILNSANSNYIDTFDTIYVAYGAGGTGQGFTIDDVNLSVDLVPEPSTFALSLLGAFGLLRRRR
ncbi:PEP-CTERM sorting domain-containing protein [Luteolibacter sp. SL250]|uniref:PEP-CTERM sorting domain-containing protein n=1 Tax=Luteolibacter sp. SL250 TaxID=2995170 RepID=UPI00226E4688|nr:PEP-CTERM sorting domain-containing protein [Luteolibacter sp. SL250]WAC19508.1 PEP-CTERM sorting domain-containing protein [Luteolibacter sp. SL250]